MTTQDADGELEQAANRLATALEKSPGPARDIVQYLLGVGEAAVGVAELASGGASPGAVLKIVKGAAAAGEAVWDLASEPSSPSSELAGLVATIDGRLAKLLEQEAQLGLLFGKSLAIDIRASLVQANNAVWAVCRHLAVLQVYCRTTARSEAFVATAMARLPAAADAAVQIAEQVRPAVALLEATATAGAKEMRSGTSTRRLYDRFTRTSWPEDRVRSS